MESSHFGKHHSHHEPMGSVPHYWKLMGLHTLKPHSQMEQTHTLKARKERDRMEKEKEENSSCVLISLLYTWFAINGGKHEYILHHATLILTILNYTNFRILLLYSTCFLIYLINEIKFHK
ncbi:hypothetical protein ACB094_03G056600 [Castanea mollissima]